MDRSSATLPVLVALSGIAVFALMDALLKGASIAIGAYSATFWRAVAGMIFVLPLYWREGMRWPPRHVLVLHLQRGVVAAGMAVTFFFALVRLPMAEAIALSFIAPLIALGLAALTLGEKIEKRAIGASLLGILGVVVIAFSRTDSSSAHPEAWLGIASVLLSACLYAWNLVLLRRQSQISGPAEVAFYQMIVIALVLLLGAPWFLDIPAPSNWGQIGGGAFFGILGLMLTSWAYGRAETQRLVPLEYSAFIWAALAGSAFFGETLSVPTLFGTVLIVSGCWIATPRRHIEQTAV